MPLLSIVIPAYNEEARILPTLQQVTRYLADQPYPWEIIVANDGSTDATSRLVAEFARANPAVTLLDLPHRGKGGAVRDGMLHAQGSWRFLCDADLSMPIEHLERFLVPELSQYDIIIGSREAPGARRYNEPARRHLMGRVFNRMARLFAVRGIRDTQCGFKCFCAEAASALFPLQRTQGFGFDIEILFMAQHLGMRLVEVPIDWYYMSHSKVRPLHDSVAMARDILRVRWLAFRGAYGKLSPSAYSRASKNSKEEP
ncbi:MAG: glycosyltransferase family 2 protein [Chloroflexi bacterium]|nr:glycosyltransferase family 2 protein [Chloroflexota bacterium]